MAKQTEIGYEASQEWADFQTGGTRIDAADLNHIEQGVTDACDAVDDLRTKRLPTYLVAQDGGTATQDLYLEPILGPCLILDLAERATYYDNGEDGDSHERTLLTSGADIDELRDSLSQRTVGEWTVFDFPNGLTIALRYTTETVKAEFPWGAIYYSGFTIAFPPGVFSQVLATDVSVHYKEGVWWVSPCQIESSKMDYYICNAKKQVDGVDVPMSFMLVGKTA